MCLWYRKRACCVAGVAGCVVQSDGSRGCCLLSGLWHESYSPVTQKGHCGSWCGGMYGTQDSFLGPFSSMDYCVCVPVGYCSPRGCGCVPCGTVQENGWCLTPCGGWYDSPRSGKTWHASWCHAGRYSPPPLARHTCAFCVPCLVCTQWRSGRKKLVGGGCVFDSQPRSLTRLPRCWCCGSACECISQAGAWDTCCGCPCRYVQEIQRRTLPAELGR